MSARQFFCALSAVGIAVPHDLEQLRGEAKEFLSDLTERDQRMLKKELAQRKQSGDSPAAEIPRDNITGITNTGSMTTGSASADSSTGAVEQAEQRKEQLTRPGAGTAFQGRPQPAPPVPRGGRPPPTCPSGRPMRSPPTKTAP